MQWPVALMKRLSVLMLCMVPFYHAHAQTQTSDWVLANGANEASWSYVREAISNCTDYATSIPKAEPTDPFIQIRVQKTLMDGKCKAILQIANKTTACFYTPDQRKAIQEEGTTAIGRLMKDENTCGVKAEQQVLATISEPVSIQRLPAKEPEIAPAAGIVVKQPESVSDKLKALFSFEKEESGPAKVKPTIHSSEIDR